MIEEIFPYIICLCMLLIIIFFHSIIIDLFVSILQIPNSKNSYNMDRPLRIVDIDVFIVGLSGCEDNLRTKLLGFYMNTFEAEKHIVSKGHAYHVQGWDFLAVEFCRPGQKPHCKETVFWQWSKIRRSWKKMSEQPRRFKGQIFSLDKKRA